MPYCCNCGRLLKPFNDNGYTCEPCKLIFAGDPRTRANVRPAPTTDSLDPATEQVLQDAVRATRELWLKMLSDTKR